MNTSITSRRWWAQLPLAMVASLTLALVNVGAAAPAAVADDVIAVTETDAQPRQTPTQQEPSGDPAPTKAADPAEPDAPEVSEAQKAPEPLEPGTGTESPEAGTPQRSPEPGDQPAPEPSGQASSGPGNEADPDESDDSLDIAPLGESPVPEEDAEPEPADFPPMPHPEGQSGHPAPASRQKRVIENVHTDAVSAYLDDGVLVAQTKADIDADGDGLIDLGTRLVTSEVLFHVGDAAKMQLPDVPGFGFLGTPGDTIWMAPMVQDPRIIWPGFSTEDPNLRGKASSLDISLIGVEGPGRAEVFMGPDHRVFSSSTELPSWRTGVPQHTHMNWVFTAPGSYTFTFQISGQVDGRHQTAQNDYTFVVGDLAAHTRATSVSLQASSTSLQPGEPVRLTANVAPAGATGAVQFLDLGSGALLGHTPVTGGQAQFVAEGLNPGTRRIVAEFVPAWSTDHKASASAVLHLTVEGEVQQRPAHSDTQPVPESELSTQNPGSMVEITSAGKQVVAGTSVTARVKDPVHAGRWLSVWLTGQNPAWRGWVQADQNGAFSLDLGDAAPRTQQLVVKDADGGFVGWDRFALVAPPNTGGGAGTDPGGTPGGGSETPDGSGPGDSDAPGGSEEPRAPSGQTCRPGITLDRGHIDAFYVSAANGKAVLQLMEDVTGHRVIREAETVLLRVKESALGTVRGAPKGTPSRGYVLPLTQRSDLIWPGWDTNRTSTSGYSDVSIKVTKVTGPGTVSLYTQGDWGAWAPILTSKRYKLPGTIREPRPAHTHAQWVFSKKGIYKLTAHAVATNPATGRSLKTASHTYVFQVGDVPLGDAFCGLRSKGAAVAKQVNAAVTKATQEALEEARAAEQAEVEAAEQEADVAEQTTGPRPTQATAQPEPEDEGLLPGISGPDGGSRTLLAGLFGLGSGLLIAGIAGATVWHVKRLRRTGAAVETPT